MPKNARLCAVFSFVAIALSSVFAEDAKPVNLVVEPAEITLSNADQRVQILVSFQMSDNSFRDVTRTVTYTIDKKQNGIISIENGRISPLADGTVALKITAQDAKK